MIERYSIDYKPTPCFSRFSSQELGLATEVVSVPLSTYVPEKYQSSAPEPSFPWRGRRSTPRCQSAPLLEVLTAKGPAVFVSVPLPVECQKVTELDAKFCEQFSVIFFHTFGKQDVRSHKQRCATRPPSTQPSTCSAHQPSIASWCC
jgi:hypothetical protein